MSDRRRRCFAKPIAQADDSALSRHATDCRCEYRGNAISPLDLTQSFCQHDGAINLAARAAIASRQFLRHLLHQPSIAAVA
jgi:hypothetical protein